MVPEWFDLVACTRQVSPRQCLKIKKPLRKFPIGSYIAGWHCLHLEGKTKAPAWQFSIQLSSNLMEIYSFSVPLREKKKIQLRCCLFFYFNDLEFSHFWFRTKEIWSDSLWSELAPRMKKSFLTIVVFGTACMTRKNCVNYDCVEICIIGKGLLMWKIHR
jgi:hypothetical protein